ncbi:MAG: hypothetical protein K6T65_13105 [Peptococcaceae bacterium]|nr:hypothetical protein [Peptococcaceae bacterium]
MDRYFLRGRVVAPTYAEAMEKLRAKVESMGYRLTDRARVKPAPVQPWVEVVWWEHDVEIQELESETKILHSSRVF